MKKIAHLSIFLGLVAGIASMLVTLASYITSPIISQAQEDAIMEAINRSFPAATHTALYEGAQGADGAVIIEIEEIFNGDETIGYVYTKVVPGLNGPITFLAGIDIDGYFTSFDTLSHSETPGIGDVIDTERFLVMIVDQPGSEPVDTIAGATGSTTAVSNALTAIYNNFRTRRPN